MVVAKIRHNWQERESFRLTRGRGEVAEYVLIHFHTDATLVFQEAPHSVSSGSLVVLSPGMPYTIQCDGLLIHDWMHLTGAVREEMERFGLAPDTLYQLRTPRRVSAVAECLEYAFQTRKRFTAELTDALLRQLFIWVAQDLDDRGHHIPLGREAYRMLVTTRAEMRDHPELHWTAERIARQVNLSVSRLYPVYRSLFGVTPNRDLIELRVSRAKSYLLQGYSVEKTAEMCGYSSVQHFIRQFKKQIGTTPKQYQR